MRFDGLVVSITTVHRSPVAARVKNHIKNEARVRAPRAEEKSFRGENTKKIRSNMYCIRSMKTALVPVKARSRLWSSSPQQHYYTMYLVY